MDIPDGDLVRLARDGDPAAFRLLIERHLPMARARPARLCPQQRLVSSRRAPARSARSVVGAG
jgi:hypothetical protein